MNLVTSQALWHPYLSLLSISAFFCLSLYISASLFITHWDVDGSVEALSSSRTSQNGLSHWDHHIRVDIRTITPEHWTPLHLRRTQKWPDVSLNCTQSIKPHKNGSWTFSVNTSPKPLLTTSSSSIRWCRLVVWHRKQYTVQSAINYGQIWVCFKAWVICITARMRVNSLWMWCIFPSFPLASARSDHPPLLKHAVPGRTQL